MFISLGGVRAAALPKLGTIGDGNLYKRIKEESEHDTLHPRRNVQT